MNNSFLLKIKQNPVTAFLILIIISRIFMLFTMAPTYRIGEEVPFLLIAKNIAISNNIFPEKEPVMSFIPYYGPLLYWINALIYKTLPSYFIILSKAFSVLIFASTLFILSKIARLYKLSQIQKIITYGFFSFLTPTIAISLGNMHEGLLLFLTIAAAWIIIKNQNKFTYPLLFALSGLLMMTRYQSIISIAGLILMIFLLKTDRKQKFKLLGVMILGVLVISGWIYIRNLEIHGTLLYHPDPRISSFSLEYMFSTPIDTHMQRAIDAYQQSFGLPLGRGAIESSLLTLNGNFVELVRFTLSVFFLPIYSLFLYAAYRQRKLFLILLPLPILFLLHGLVQAPIMASNTAARYMLAGMPFLSIVLASSLNLFQNKWKKIIIVYLLLVILSIGSLSIYSQYTKTQHENQILGSFDNLLKQNPGKSLLMLEQEDLIRGLVNLHFDITPIVVKTFTCEEKMKTLSILNYCIKNNEVFVTSEKFYLFKKYENS